MSVVDLKVHLQKESFLTIYSQMIIMMMISLVWFDDAYIDAHIDDDDGGGDDDDDDNDDDDDDDCVLFVFYLWLDIVQ